MFVGSYTPKLDEKNRLFLPAKFREQLAEGLVVTKGQDFCLTVFPRADFAAMTGRIQEAPLTVRQAREYGRFLAMRAAEDKPDKQGRITIPPLLKEYAGLDREVVVIGALNRVEIWDPEPDRGLGGRAQPDVRRHERGHLPRLARTGTRPAPTHNTTQGFAQRGLAPAPVIWGTFPGSRRPSPRRARRRPHEARARGSGQGPDWANPVSTSTTAHTSSTTSAIERGRTDESHTHSTPVAGVARRPARASGPPPGARRGGADGVLRDHVDGPRRRAPPAGPPLQRGR